MDQQPASPTHPKPTPKPTMEQQWTLVDQYIASKLAPADKPLDEALHDSEAAKLPPINVSPNQGKFLHLLVRLMGAKRILEIGTLGGYSTIWLARALPAGGQVITVEVDPDRADLARANIARSGLAESVNIRVGAALDILPQLAGEEREPFDLVFVDADKRNNPNYFQWALKLTRTGSLIIIDNVVRQGTITEDHSTDPDIQGTRRLFDMLAAEKRVCAAALQTVGVKGYDGLAMVVVM